jgi:EAL domain-containing protein (putative c-di-GMP-specific phosphodiesterase class I)
MDPTHRVGITDELADKWSISKERIVLEITEETAIRNCKLFKDTIVYYKKRGYKIAIDDFGAGYGGLKMLSIIEPDFIKIDRHFISNIDKAAVKFNLVDSIASACHRLGIKVIAEGIEQGEELKVVMNMGIELLQGYYLAHPGLWCKG